MVLLDFTSLANRLLWFGIDFQHQENNEKYAFDKGYHACRRCRLRTQRDCLKGSPEAGNKVVSTGGYNYRLGSGAVPNSPLVEPDATLQVSS